MCGDWFAGVNLAIFFGTQAFRAGFLRGKCRGVCRGCNSVISSNFQFAHFAQFAQQTGGGNFGRAKILEHSIACIPALYQLLSDVYSIKNFAIQYFIIRVFGEWFFMKTIGRSGGYLYRLYCRYSQQEWFENISEYNWAEGPTLR